MVSSNVVRSATYIAFVVAYTSARDLNFCGTFSYVELLLDELLLGDVLVVSEEVHNICKNIYVICL